MGKVAAIQMTSGHVVEDNLAAAAELLRDTARRLGLWIMGGTTVIKGDSAARVANASLLIDADGKRVARYDKIHLFDVAIPGREERYLESTHVMPGREAVIADTPVGKLGLSVCYDMRFPELYL